MSKPKRLPLPKTGLKGLQHHWREDLLAGFSIALIALPLSLGIAKASGFPPIAGLWTAIIGGLLVSRVKGGWMTINGPAAGLIVVMLGTLSGFPGLDDPTAKYQYALAAVVCSGGLVAVFGFLKLARYVEFFPLAVVNGMLVAIGLIIMIKQFYEALGIHPETDNIFLMLLYLPYSFHETVPEVALISLAAGLVLVLHPYLKGTFLRKVPAAVFLLAVCIPLEQYLDLYPDYRVRLPDEPLKGIVLPDFSQALNPNFFLSVVSIAFVVFIETLLIASAVEKLDRHQRKSRLDREVFGNGLGSLASGLIGGLPMIAEIIRSSANITYGAKTRWANFFHAVFLLLFVIFLAEFIQMIPLAALAVLLVAVGYSLGHPKKYTLAWRNGFSHFAIFLTTILGILAFGMLEGIVIGLLAYLVVNLLRGVPLRYFFNCNTELDKKGGVPILRVKNAAVFSNYLHLKRQLENLRDQPEIVLDLRPAQTVDFTTIDHLRRYQLQASRQDRKVNIIGAKVRRSKAWQPEPGEESANLE